MATDFYYLCYNCLMNSHQWIFLSPHLDDVTLSCGGLVWDFAHQGALVEIWTIFAGYPSDEDYSEFAHQNHLSWGKAGVEAIEMRRAEDVNACHLLGAQPHHFSWPDVIYRRYPDTGQPVVNDNGDLFQAPPESILINTIAQTLSQEIPPEAILVLPMGLGGHLDHRAVVEVGKLLNRVNYYYADYPYILWSFDTPLLTDDTHQKIHRPLNQDAFTAWVEAVLCYASQLSSFWRDEEETWLGLKNYLAGGGGRLWQKAAS